MIIFMQCTIDYMFQQDPTGVVEYFTSLGVPKVKQTASGIKYYTYE